MEWLSPYQQDSYNNVLKDMGISVFKTHSYNTAQLLYFNNLSSPNLVAWEANNIVEVNERPDNSSVWVFEGIYKYADIVDWNIDKYYSLVIPKNANLVDYYSSNNRRNIKKAILNNLEYGQTSSLEEIKIAANLFANNENLTGGLDFGTFK